MARKRDEYKKAADLPLVAVDFGSHSVRAMVGERVSDSVFRVLAVEEFNERPDAINCGKIESTADVGFALNRVFSLLSNRLNGQEITSAFVCVGDETMHVVEASAKRDLLRNTRLKSRMADLDKELKKECKEKIERTYPDKCVLQLIVRGYQLDGIWYGQLTDELEATKIEVYYNVFYADKSLLQNIEQSFLKAGKTLEGYFVRPDALLSLFAQEDGDKVLNEGCAVLDMGAQTTSLTVFKENMYLDHFVYPSGGDAITAHLYDKGVTMQTAKTLKTRYACASSAQVEDNKMLRFHLDPSESDQEMKLSVAELSSVVETALCPILGPILDKLAEHTDRVKWLYITGGASMLQGMDAYLQSKVPCRVLYGAHSSLVTRDTDDHYLEPTYASLVGTLLLAQDVRDSHPEKKIKTGGFIEKIERVGDVFLDLFSPS